MTSLSRGAKFPLYLAASYALLVIFASLYPFSGWKNSGAEFFSFVLAPWPKYAAVSDILINVVAYSPLGFLICLHFLSRFRPETAIILAMALCAALSFSMESAQTFLPTRVSSNIDWFANSFGGLLGAMFARKASHFKFIATHLAGLRDKWILPGATGDLGLALLALWFFTQINPSLPIMGSWVPDLGEPLLRLFSPHRFSFLETTSICLNFFSLGLLCTLISKGAPRITPVLLLLFLSILVKLVSSALLLKSSVFFIWASDEAMIGSTIGFFFLYFFLDRSQKVRIILTACAIALHLASIDFSAASPLSELFLFNWPYAQLSNMSGATSFFAKLWPFLALAYLALIYPYQRKKNAL